MSPLIASLRRALVAILVAPLRAYRYAISPMLPARCRFHPSCSDYAIEALRRHGPLRGAWLATGRVCRCHPWNEGGVDLVPQGGTPAVSGDRSPDPHPLVRDAFARWPAALRGEPPARTK